MNAATFWNFVDKTDGCWPWKGSVSRWGYGTARFNGVHQNAHRIAWQLTRGAVPPGRLVCHSCDNRLCVNPDHLWIGTQRDNMRDAWQKGRRDETGKGDGHWRSRMPEKVARGTTCYNAKVTEDDVRAIRASSESATHLARRYGISKQAIGLIRKRKNWAHVT